MTDPGNKLVKFANAVIWLVGLKILPVCIGRWYVNKEEKIACRSLQIGWRLGWASEDLPEGTTELQRFATSHGIDWPPNRKGPRE